VSAPRHPDWPERDRTAGEPWSLVGEARVNVLPVIDLPGQRIGVTKLGLVPVQWPHGRRHLVPTHDGAAVMRTLCGRRWWNDAERGEPLTAESPEPLTDCTNCARSRTLEYWREQNPKPEA
jgi:hypothetical protein